MQGVSSISVTVISERSLPFFYVMNSNLHGIRLQLLYSQSNLNPFISVLSFYFPSAFVSSNRFNSFFLIHFYHCISNLILQGISFISLKIIQVIHSTVLCCIVEMDRNRTYMCLIAHNFLWALPSKQTLVWSFQRSHSFEFSYFIFLLLISLARLPIHLIVSLFSIRLI